MNLILLWNPTKSADTHSHADQTIPNKNAAREGGRGECGSRDCGWDEGDEMSSGSNVGWPKSNYPAVHRVSNRWKRRQHAPSTSFFTTCLSLVCQCVCLLKPFGHFIQIFLNNLNESTKVSPGLIWIKFDINSVNHRNSIKFYSSSRIKYADSKYLNFISKFQKYKAGTAAVSSLPWKFARTWLELN